MFSHRLSFSLAVFVLQGPFYFLHFARAWSSVEVPDRLPLWLVRHFLRPFTFRSTPAPNSFSPFSRAPPPTTWFNRRVCDKVGGHPPLTGLPAQRICIVGRDTRPAKEKMFFGASCPLCLFPMCGQLPPDLPDHFKANTCNAAKGDPSRREGPPTQRSIAGFLDHDGLPPVHLRRFLVPPA